MDSHIEALYEYIRDAKETLRVLEIELLKAQEKCQHNYMCIRDDDYNHTRFVYICKKCNFYTTHQPENFVKE